MVTCIACSGETGSRTIGPNALEVCRTCGSASLSRPQPRTVNYWPESLEQVEAFWTAAKSRYFSSALSLLEDRSAGRRLLDVGGGVGHFASLAIGRGWDAYSLDVSDVATEAAAELLGPTRVLRSLEEAGCEAYDVVTMWCVVAHVPDPSQLLTEAATKLTPGGLMWITTPNFAFQRRYARIRNLVGKPIDFSGDDHVHQFTPRGLDALARPAGLAQWTWHYRGITEHCALSASANRLLLSSKRIWNEAASSLMRIGGPNLTSELQALTSKLG